MHFIQLKLKIDMRAFLEFWLDTLKKGSKHQNDDPGKTREVCAVATQLGR